MPSYPLQEYNEKVEISFLSEDTKYYFWCKVQVPITFTSVGLVVKVNSCKLEENSLMPLRECLSLTHLKPTLSK